MYNKAACNSLQWCAPALLQLPSQEASLPEMHGIRFLRYRESAVHPEYQGRQKYLPYNPQEGGSYWYNKGYLPGFQLL